MTYASGRSWLSILLLWLTFFVGVPSAYAAAGDIFSVQDAAGDAFRVTSGGVAIVKAVNVSETVTADNVTVNGTIHTPTVNATTVKATQANATQANVTRLVHGLVAINATNYSIPTAHSTFYAVVNGNAQNITLPDPNALEDGDFIIIQDQIGQAASNTIAVNSTNTTGAGNINAVAFVNITAAYGAKVYTQRAGKWYAR
jgi:hypothetical protein